ncbi:MAG: lysophospholipid acyltransferase family protein [bacterium]
MLYYLYKIASLLAEGLPLSCAYALSRLISWAFYWVVPRYRWTLLDNLSLAFPDVNRSKRTEMARRIYRNVGYYLVEFLRYSKIGPHNIDDFVEIEGLEKVDRAFSLGKGVIFVSGHIGNWELGGAALAIRGYTMNVIVQEASDPRIRDLFNRRRESRGLRVIPLGASLREGLEALRRNEALVIIADRDITGRGLKVNFFGHSVRMPTGPAALALKTGAPVVAGFIVRRGRKHHIFFLEPLILHPTGDKERDLKVYTQRIAGILEEQIRKHPENWFAFYPLRG